MRIVSKGVSDVGRKREANEDCFATVPEDSLFVVADGMGGHAAGEVASRLAVTAIADFIASTRRDAEVTWPYDYDVTMSVEGNRLKTAIRLANQKILDTISHKKELEGMGTTLVSTLIADGRACVGHVGDSRAYLIRNGVISQLTSDHSWVNEQVKLGFLTRSDAGRHPFRNVVTRALGSKEDVVDRAQPVPPAGALADGLDGRYALEVAARDLAGNPASAVVNVVVDVAEQDLKAGDLLLLCSDGLNTMLDDERIVRLVTENGDDVEAAAKALIAGANESGGEDNVTVILIKIEESAGDPPEPA
jgi:protein phosphatase